MCPLHNNAYLHISNTWNQLVCIRYVYFMDSPISLMMLLYVRSYQIDFMFHIAGFRGSCLRWAIWSSPIPILIQYRHLAPYKCDAIPSLVLEECGHILTWSTSIIVIMTTSSVWLSILAKHGKTLNSGQAFVGRQVFEGMCFISYDIFFLYFVCHLCQNLGLVLSSKHEINLIWPNILV